MQEGLRAAIDCAQCPPGGLAIADSCGEQSGSTTRERSLDATPPPARRVHERWPSAGASDQRLLGFPRAGDVAGSRRFGSGGDMVGSHVHVTFSASEPPPSRGRLSILAKVTSRTMPRVRYRGRSAIAGSLLAEISLSKLLFACMLSIVLPAIVLGLAPFVATAWVAKASGSLPSWRARRGPYPAPCLLWGGTGGVLFSEAEANFWSLNALAVQLGYALCREALRHVADEFR